MNKIADLLPASNIVVDADASTKAQLFSLAGALFETSANIPRDSVAASLTAREKLGSTGLGQGIAIPHGRMRGLKEARAAFIRLREPIPFDAPDGKPVAQVFVLLVPEQATDQHLQLLSELAQMFSERSFRDKLAHARDAAEIGTLIGHWQPSPG
ncbi:MAG: PTS sugar transporter subunit IIA [Proteobacteria bacterium]|nr:PTS sugar transporter subunit IIA [Pseudomonadota bacterium]